MSSLPDTNPNPALKQQGKMPRWIPILGFVVLVALGVFAGYQSGLSQRKAAQATVVAQQVEEQYQLGLDAMNNGQYEVALQHFQFVIQHDSNYPGVQDAYTKLVIWMSVSPTPSPTITPTITSTPDLRGVETIFNQAKQYIAASDWDNALATLDNLRKSDPTYRTAEVDGMYFISLRSRGYAKIFPGSCQDTNLEGGIYDLTLAERFGPLDSGAAGLRTFARYYSTGAAFWEVDWLQAQYYFGQTMLGYPTLMDSSCKTAQDRWREATIEYARQLAAKGDYCGAQTQFDAAFTVNSDENVPYYATATAVYLTCHPATSTRVRTQTPQVTDTPQLVVDTPTETPTP
jgi:tetratricopeptide (TPR) repeat protein